MLGGDLNDVRQLALACLMGWEAEESTAKEDRDLRSMIIAYHLGRAKEIFDSIDGKREEDFAPELTEEEMESYQPLSVEETSAAIEQLRKFGVAIEE